MNKGNRGKKDAEETDGDKNMLEGGAVRAREKKKTMLEHIDSREEIVPSKFYPAYFISGNSLERVGNGASPPGLDFSIGGDLACTSAPLLSFVANMHRMGAEPCLKFLEIALRSSRRSSRTESYNFTQFFVPEITIADVSHRIERVFGCEP